MGMYLNPGNISFLEAARSKIYVDKTRLIHYTNENLFTKEKYMAVSRPRRFGKTMALDMLCAYYCRDCESKELFAGFQITQDESFEKHLNQYNVIQINVRDAISTSKSIEDMTAKFTARLLYELREEYPDVKLFDESDLMQCLNDFYSKTQVPFVFLVDEWDAPFRVKGISEDARIKYLDFLRLILKDKPYVALAYMTGILPIKKYGEHSALNMFTEYSMTNQRELAEFVGFTETEVKALCEKYDMSYDETRRWYDGYNLRGLSVYNPRSVVMAMTGHGFDSYWTRTETYEALKVYISLNIDGLKDKIIQMIAAEHVSINTLKFTNDMTTFKSADDVLTLLIHLGYLTYDFDRQECYIPNNEVQQEFVNSIEDGGWEEIMTAIRESDKLLAATLDKDTAIVEALLEKAHQSETSIMAYNDENALASVITVAYYTARKQYDLVRELPGGKGYADVCFLPRRGVEHPAMVVELKVDQSRESAIDQIKRKQYTEGLAGYRGKVLLVGIAYDKKTKKHSCLIEETIK